MEQSLGKELIKEIRIGFIRKGTSLNKFCAENELDNGNVRKALLGEWNGEKAIALRNFIISAATESNDETLD